MEVESKPLCPLKIGKMATAQPRCFPERGVAMVEAALTLAIIMACVFAIVEVSRFFLVEGALSRASQAAMNHAQKAAGFDVDLRNCSSLAARPCSDVAAVRQSLERLVHADTVAVLPNRINGGSNSRFMRFQHFYFRSNGAGGLVADVAPEPNGLDVLALRPGDAARILREDGTPTTYILCHQQILPPAGLVACSNSSATGARAMLPEDTMTGLLSTYPIEVRAEGAFTMIVPFDRIIR